MSPFPTVHTTLTILNVATRTAGASTQPALRLSSRRATCKRTNLKRAGSSNQATLGLAIGGDGSRAHKTACVLRICRLKSKATQHQRCTLTRAAKSMSEFDRMSPKPSWWSRPGRPQCCCRIDWSSSSCCCGCRHAPRLCARGCAQPEWSFMRPTCGTTRLHARHAVVAAAGRGRSGGHQCEEFAIGCWCCTAMRLLAVYWVGCLMCLVTLIRWIATVTAFCASV